jgi:hypothetical protein
MSDNANRPALVFAPSFGIGLATSPAFREKSQRPPWRTVIGDKAEQAYRRSDALEKRRKLMDAWAEYCEPRGSSNVVQMGKR